MQLRDEGRVRGIREREELAPVAQLHADDVRGIRHAALEARHVELAAEDEGRAQDADRGPADEAARPEYGEALLEQHLGGEPAEEGPGGHAERIYHGVAEVVGLGEAQVVDEVADEEGREDGGDCLEHRSQRRHCHHVARRFHVPPQVKRERDEQQYDSHGGVDYEPVPAAYPADRLAGRAGRVGIVIVQPAQERDERGEDIRPVPDAAVAEAEAEIHRHHHGYLAERPGRDVHRGEEQRHHHGVPRQQRAEGRDAEEGGNEQRRAREVLPERGRVGEAAHRREEQREQEDNHVDREQRQQPRRGAGGEHRAPPHGQRGVEVGAALIVQVREHGHRRRAGRERAEPYAGCGHGVHGVVAHRPRLRELMRVVQYAERQRDEPDEGVERPDRPEALHALLEHAGVKA